MVRKKIDWSIEFKEILEEILEFYIERNGNQRYSKSLLKQIKKSISLIANNNFIGKLTEEYNVRVIFKDNYAIFYEIKEKVVEIQLVWDTRRNPKDLQI
ncbi:MAG: type II toxin-antitoxin system RelE/ParE family toxin [Bacteroidota bacterium]|nr:type II toxin-antitoxin system RelE/ParE family toxin [Bacteroidota bacterium]